MDEQKSRLRTLLRQRRAGFSMEEIAAKSQAITTKTKELVSGANIKRAHCYSSTSKEVGTAELIAWLTSQGVIVDVPMVGVTVPTEQEYKTVYDLIIVPMLGFDSLLYRLGYGGGYYDRLLAAQPQALKLGLCFEAGRCDALPVELHDQRLDGIISEHRVYRGKLV